MIKINKRAAASYAGLKNQHFPRLKNYEITVAYDYTDGSWMKNDGESWKPSTSPFE